ncbi:MAG: hypothetical protein C4334_07775 [Pyrinomonas sp.]
MKRRPEGRFIAGGYFGNWTLDERIEETPRTRRTQLKTACRLKPIISLFAQAESRALGLFRPRLQQLA